MNKDMDAIRQIVNTVKKSDSIVTKIDGMSDDVFKFNAMLLIESGLVLGKCKDSNSRSGSPIPIVVLIFRLTWKGFDFADSIQDDDIWAKAKKTFQSQPGHGLLKYLLNILNMKSKLNLE